jgi:demethylmenaquinone methyltransferase/2-methoxy-6-polyprenyl-1,4-benzoquinol methylase
MDGKKLIKGQVEYYRARAPEYDEWFFRQGRYDRGPAHRAQWLGEASAIEAVLRSTVRDGEVLELACGTGLWTRHLAQSNRRVVAVDAAPEALAQNRERVHAGNVDYVIADIFSWRAAAKFDFVFFSFWLSHVPDEMFEAFWTRVSDMLSPDGRVFFIDSLLEESSSARDHAPLDRSGLSRRKLNDGSEFDIVKIFYQPEELEARLRGLGWRGWVRTTETFFLYGCVERVSAPGSDADWESAPETLTPP